MSGLTPEKEGRWGIGSRVVAVMVVGAAVVALVTFGRLRQAPPERPRDIDAVYGYVAGLAWRMGLDPYDYPRYERLGRSVGGAPIRCSFAYAPTAAALVMPLSRLTPGAADRALAALNVASALAAGFVLAAAVGRRVGEALGGWRPVASAGVAALAIGSPQAALNLYQGQTTLFCLALVCLAFWADERGRPLLCGALLGVATFKISLPVFVIALVLFERRWKVLGALAVTALLLASYPLLRDGPVGLARGWLGAMRLYREFPWNRPDYESAFGFAGALKGVGLPTGLAPLVALLGLGWLYLRRNVADPLERFAVALALPVLFVSGHLYDAVAFSPLYAAVLLATRRTPPAFAASVVGIALMVLPPSIWNRLVPFRWGKEVVALGLLAVLVACVELRVARKAETLRGVAVDQG